MEGKVNVIVVISQKLGSVGSVQQQINLFVPNAPF